MVAAAIDRQPAIATIRNKNFEEIILPIPIVERDSQSLTLDSPDNTRVPNKIALMESVVVRYRPLSQSQRLRRGEPDPLCALRAIPNLTLELKGT